MTGSGAGASLLQAIATVEPTGSCPVGSITTHCRQVLATGLSRLVVVWGEMPAQYEPAVGCVPLMNSNPGFSTPWPASTAPAEVEIWRRPTGVLLAVNALLICVSVAAWL